MENRLQPAQLVTPPGSPTLGPTETKENLEVTDTPEPREMMPELATAFAPPPYSSSPRTRNPTTRWAPYSVASGTNPAASCLTSARVNPRRGIRPSSPARPAGGNRPGPSPRATLRPAPAGKGLASHASGNPPRAATGGLPRAGQPSGARLANNVASAQDELLLASVTAIRTCMDTLSKVGRLLDTRSAAAVSLGAAAVPSSLAAPSPRPPPSSGIPPQHQWASASRQNQSGSLAQWLNSQQNSQLYLPNRYALTYN